jgi:hypothetical protein
MKIKSFKIFEKKKVTISKDEIIDEFQDYLDDLDNDKIKVKFHGDVITIKITNDSWLTGKSGIDIPRTHASIWTKLSNSIDMVCKLHGLNLIDIEFDNHEDGSLKVVEISLSDKSRDQMSGIDISFNDIIDFAEKNTGIEDIFVLDTKKKLLQTIGKVVAETTRNVFHTHDDYTTLTVSSLEDTKFCIPTCRDGDELESSVGYSLYVRKKSISDIPNLPIFIYYGGVSRKPLKMVLGSEFSDDNIIEQIEDISSLKTSVILVI